MEIHVPKKTRSSASLHPPQKIKLPHVPSPEKNSHKFTLHPYKWQILILWIIIYLLYNINYSFTPAPFLSKISIHRNRSSRQQCSSIESRLYSLVSGHSGRRVLHTWGPWPNFRLCARLNVLLYSWMFVGWYMYRCVCIHCIHCSAVGVNCKLWLQQLGIP